jgi:hypothetical protein
MTTTKIRRYHTSSPITAGRSESAKTLYWRSNGSSLELPSTAGLAEDLPVSSDVERQLHFVTSPSAADWPKGSSGSGRELPLPEFIAVKLPLVFRFPEAAFGH